MNMKNLLKNNFVTFLIVHFLVWSGIPQLRPSLPMDSIEAIMWGRYCDWGTNKHPPLSGFPASWFYDWFGSAGIYILSQVCVLFGFIYIYKLAKCFLEEKKAVLAVMVLEGVIYYGFSSMEYNVNVLSLALWPATSYYFYLAVRDGKWPHWALTGLFAGLNVMNKYVGGVLLLCMAAYMLFTSQGRAKFKTFGPYLTFAVFLAIIAPHLVWLYKHDFYVVGYFAGRAAHEASESVWWEVAEHFYFPLKFLLAQILFMLLALAVYFLTYRKAEKEASEPSAAQLQFLKFMGILPVLVFAAVSFVFGLKMKSMWGFPVMYMLGILLFVYYPFRLTERLYKKAVRSVYVVMGLLAVAATAIIVFDRSEKINFPGAVFAEKMSEIWKKHTGSDLAYAGGEIWYVSNVALYGESNPKPVAEMKPEHNPWFSAQDIMQKGALVIFPDRSRILELRKIYKNMSLPYEYKLEIKNKAGKVKKKTIYYGFLKPEVKND